jgi:RNA polymerase sigma factor (sigma-70 family)
LNDQELIRLCLLGDQEGQKLLYNRFATPMARLCLRYVKDEGEAADVLIEGFMKVYTMLKKFEYRDENSLAGWVKQIMINQCLMSLRKKRMTIAIDQASLEPEAVHSDQTDLSAEEIVGLIQTLPAGYRTIFNLFAIDGYSHKEIADVLGISESASRSQLTHARNKLKQLLRAHGWR